MNINFKGMLTAVQHKEYTNKSGDLIKYVNLKILDEVNGDAIEFRLNKDIQKQEISELSPFKIYNWLAEMGKGYNNQIAVEVIAWDQQ
jgi:hypothetical protein